MEGVRTLHIEGQGSFRLRIPIQQLQIEDLIAVLRKARLDKIVLYIGFISDGTEANCPLYDDVQSGQRVLYKVQKPDNCTRRGPRIQIQFQNSYINKCLPFFMFMSSQYTQFKVWQRLPLSRAMLSPTRGRCYLEGVVWPYPGYSAL